MLAARPGGGGAIAPFDLAGRGSDFLGAVQVPVGLTAGLLALIVAALGAVQLVRGFGDRAATVVSVSAGLFTLAFLAWAARDDTLPLLGLFQNTLSGSVPLALGAMWRGALGSPDAIASATLVRATPLIIIGLAFALALRAGRLG